jgi:hypothetical protein
MAVVREDDAFVQMPSKPFPVAAVEPACGDVRLGSDSPATTGADEGAGALAPVAGAPV